MAQQLDGLRVAILVTQGFEQSELLEPQKALKEAGAHVDIVSPKEDSVRGWDHDHWGKEVDVNVPLTQARADDYDALVLPGGVMNPDYLRINDKAIGFIKEFVSAEKPIAAICHGPWTLIEAGAVKGQRMTSWPSLKTDLRNAGAEWVDEEIVVDGRLVTSRKPDDLPAFNREVVRLLGENQSRQPSQPRMRDQSHPTA